MIRESLCVVFKFWLRFCSRFCSCWIMRHMAKCSLVQIHVDMTLSRIKVNRSQERCSVMISKMCILKSPYSRWATLYLYLPSTLFSSEGMIFPHIFLNYLSPYSLFHSFLFRFIFDFRKSSYLFPYLLIFTSFLPSMHYFTRLFAHNHEICERSWSGAWHCSFSLLGVTWYHALHRKKAGRTGERFRIYCTQEHSDNHSLPPDGVVVQNVDISSAFFGVPYVYPFKSNDDVPNQLCKTFWNGYFAWDGHACLNYLHATPQTLWSTMPLCMMWSGLRRQM